MTVSQRAVLDLSLGPGAGDLRIGEHAGGTPERRVGVELLDCRVAKLPTNNLSLEKEQVKLSLKSSCFQHKMQVQLKMHSLLKVILQLTALAYNNQFLIRLDPKSISCHGVFS